MPTQNFWILTEPDHGEYEVDEYTSVRDYQAALEELENDNVTVIATGTGSIDCHMI